ncbi:P1 family peptidase, partial [Rhizobium ruizarguesonis]
ALGSATIGDGPHFWAAPFEKDAEFGGLGMPDVADHRMRLKGMNTPATTIGAVVTDAQLTKAEAHRLSLAGHDGLARALLPAHLPLDGDTVFAASTAKHRRDDMASLMELCHLATIVMARAIARGVYAATALPVEGAQKAWRDRYASSG